MWGCCWMGQETWWQRSWKRKMCFLHLSPSWQVQPLGSSDQGEDCIKEDLTWEKEDQVRDIKIQECKGSWLMSFWDHSQTPLKVMGEIFVFLLFPGLGFWRSSSAEITIKCLDLWICNDENNFPEQLLFMSCHRAACSHHRDAKKDLPCLRLILGETQQEGRVKVLPVLCLVPDCSSSSPVQPCDFSQKPEAPVGFSQIIAPTNSTAVCF